MEPTWERDLEALMQRRRQQESRLNRALGELLGSGSGRDRTLKEIEEMEAALRAIASFVGELDP